MPGKLRRWSESASRAKRVVCQTQVRAAMIKSILEAVFSSPEYVVNCLSWGLESEMQQTESKAIFIRQGQKAKDQVYIPSLYVYPKATMPINLPKSFLLPVNH